MNSALQKASDPRKEVLVQDESPDARVSLFTSIIAPGASPELTALVWHYARALDLDPLRKMVMLISMDRKNDRGGWDKEYGVIVGVHGVIALLGRQKDYAGLHSGVVYPGESCSIDSDGNVSHVYDVIARSAQQAGAPVLPLGAYATVSRMMHGRLVKFTSYTPFVEVAQTTWKAPPSGGAKKKVLRFIWASRPSWMNEKCAIMFSARKAYDHILGKVYGAEEFGALSTEDGIAVPEGFGDRIESIEVEPEHVESPSIRAGLIPGSETPATEPEDDGGLTDSFGRMVDASNTLDGLAGDSVFGDGAPEPEAPPSPEDAERAIARAISHGAMTFTKKPRAFVKEDGAGARYLVDAEALRVMGTEEPMLLTGASPEDVIRAAKAINAICHERRNRHGR